ncbi:hypothetical protein [Nostoc sp.]|uniref:hypothetical protein n=1 Tax=Nostoc sp. TaxID=1180 RepID=UPI002FF47C60
MGWRQHQAWIISRFYSPTNRDASDDTLDDAQISADTYWCIALLMKRCEMRKRSSS